MGSSRRSALTGTAAIVMVLASSLLIAAVPNFSKLAYETGASVPLALSVSFANIHVAGLALAFLGCLGAAGLVIFSGDAVAESTSSLVSLYTSITALVVVLVASLFMGPVVLPGTPLGWFGERLSPLQWLGVVIVVAGLLLLELPARDVERLKARLSLG